MIRRLILPGMLAALVALAGASGGFAASVTDQLKLQIARVIRTLEDPALKGSAKAQERHRALREATEGAFDWAEMARRALGGHWDGRSGAERAEFTALFRDLIERAYLSKVERYSGEPIRYAGESAEGEHAVVRTRLVTRQGQEVAIDYRMARQNERWLINDIVVEGVSLTANYRAQFNEIIRTSSYQELVRKIRTRLS